MYHGYLFELSGPSEGRLCSGKDDCINWWLVLPIRLLYYSGKIQVISVSLIIKYNMLVKSFNGTYSRQNFTLQFFTLVGKNQTQNKTLSFQCHPFL